MAITFSPSSAREAARLEVKVVFPTPPLPEVMRINLVINQLLIFQPLSLTISKKQKETKILSFF
jgi:hypothetical protein